MLVRRRLKLSKAQSSIGRWTDVLAPRPTGELCPALPADIADALVAWVQTLPEPRPSLEEAVALALRDWLTGQGFLPFHDAPEDAH